jgi:hypothetical protein
VSDKKYKDCIDGCHAGKHPENCMASLCTVHREYSRNKKEKQMNIKIWIENEKDWIAVQEKAFKLGYGWGAGKAKTILHLDALTDGGMPIGFFAPGMMGLGWSIDKHYFAGVENTEMTVADFLRLPEYSPGSEVVERNITEDKMRKGIFESEEEARAVITCVTPIDTISTSPYIRQPRELSENEVNETLETLKAAGLIKKSALEEARTRYEQYADDYCNNHKGFLPPEIRNYVFALNKEIERLKNAPKI